MFVKRSLEFRLFRCCRIGLLSGPGGMHPTKVLSKQILAVEIIRPLGGDVAALEVTTVVFEFEMLRGEMALPFVLGAECAFAAVLFETAAVCLFAVAVGGG